MDKLFEVKSHSKAGQARRDARTKEEAEEGRKERKEGRKEGGYSVRGKRQTASIHKVSRGRRLNVCVWRGSRDFCMGASEYLHCGARHAK